MPQQWFIQHMVSLSKLQATSCVSDRIFFQLAWLHAIGPKRAVETWTAQKSSIIHQRWLQLYWASNFSGCSAFHWCMTSMCTLVCEASDLCSDDARCSRFATSLTAIELGMPGASSDCILRKVPLSTFPSTETFVHALNHCFEFAASPSAFSYSKVHLTSQLWTSWYYTWNWVAILCLHALKWATCVPTKDMKYIACYIFVVAKML